MKNQNLAHAKKAKNDEFYTRLDDVPANSRITVITSKAGLSSATVMIPSGPPSGVTSISISVFWA